MARTHIKSSVAGAGKNAGQGLSRVSKRNPSTNLEGWALNVYRILGLIQDEVLSMLTGATSRRTAKNEAKEAFIKATEAKDKAADDYAEDSNMMTAQVLEYASSQYEKARQAVTAFEDEHAESTRAIRSWNGWLARFGAEVHKKVDHIDPVTKETVKGETHQERKERTKKALIGLASLTSSKRQAEAPLALPDIDILALATGRKADELKKTLCDAQGKPMFSDMPEGMTEYLSEVSQNQETKTEVREFLVSAGF